MMAKNLEGKNCPKFKADATSNQVVSNETYNKFIISNKPVTNELNSIKIEEEKVKKSTLKKIQQRSMGRPRK